VGARVVLTDWPVPTAGSGGAPCTEQVGACRRATQNPIAFVEKTVQSINLHLKNPDSLTRPGVSPWVLAITPLTKIYGWHKPLVTHP